MYVATVLVLAQALASDPTLPSVPATALAFVAQQLGVPYLWGGTGDGGYDCSVWSRRPTRSPACPSPGWPRTQFDAGPSAGARSLAPGDLVFFGGSTIDVTHVGIYLGGGTMIDAPHTGTVVRSDSVPTTPGASWGGELFRRGHDAVGIGSGWTSGIVVIPGLMPDYLHFRSLTTPTNGHRSVPMTWV